MIKQLGSIKPLWILLCVQLTQIASNLLAYRTGNNTKIRMNINN